MASNDRAIVLFSGGQDSTTCLAWALNRYPHLETLGFFYGQRHRVELDSRAPIRTKLAEKWPGRLGPDHLLDISVGMAALGDTALTTQSEIAIGAEGLPTTFVPGRNLIFLVYAAALAYRRDIKHIVAGMCETDFSGYPDCRDDTIKAMQISLNLGMQRRFVLETPLMWIDKAATWAMAETLGILDVVIQDTHTCYLGDRSRLHEWGLGCGECPACALRAEGFRKWQSKKKIGGEAPPQTPSLF